MKIKLSLLLCLGILLTACKKNTVNPNNEAIKGTWELRATRGGNIIPATYPPGNGHILSFGDASFAEYAAGSVVYSGSYGRSTNTDAQYAVVANNNGSPFTNWVNIVQDTLALIPGNPDAATGLYIKTSSVPR
jgi:hypothetical protein